jgi:hypothetical protein
MRPASRIGMFASVVSLPHSVLIIILCGGERRGAIRSFTVNGATRFESQLVQGSSSQ